MADEELIKILKQGPHVWNECRSKQLDRSGVIRPPDTDLTGINLHGANLKGALLTKTNLNDANLSNADLSGAHLTGANLGLANLTGADLRGADLRGAKNLTQMQLDQACGDAHNKVARGPHNKAVPAAGAAGSISADYAKRLTQDEARRDRRQHSAAAELLRKGGHD
jgi:hypothetical protein